MAEEMFAGDSIFAYLRAMKHRLSLLLPVVAASVVVLCSCSGKRYAVTAVERTRLLVDSVYDRQPVDEAVAFVAPYRQQVDSIMSPVVGRSSRYLSSYRPESPLSNLLADILVWGGQSYGEEPLMGVYNMGGIRAAFAEGDITYGDVIDVAPFENKICFLTLTGDHLLQLLAQIASTGGEGVSHGVELSVAADGRLLGARLHGEAIVPERAYRVVTLDYLAQGNDKLEAFKQGTDVNAPTDDDANVRYIIIRYARAMMERGEAIDAAVEGRITIEQ